MKAEECKNEVLKIMGGKSEIVQVDWMKTQGGEYYIRLSFKANAKQIAKLKPILKEFYQQELT